MDDFLGLGERRFGPGSCVVLVGRSGSGKTTYLDWLLNDHPSFRDLRAVRLYVPEQHEAPKTAGFEVLAVDEILTAQQWRRALAWRPRGATLLATAHLSAWTLRRSCPRATVLTCDQDLAKLRRHLERLGVGASEASLAAFAKRFGATYTDLEIILEAAGRPPSFEEAWRWYTRFGSID